LAGSACREIFGVQCISVAHAINPAFLADDAAIERIAGVELQPGLCRQRLELPARFRLVQTGGQQRLGGRSLVEHEIMVVAAADSDLVVAPVRRIVRSPRPRLHGRAPRLSRRRRRQAPQPLQDRPRGCRQSAWVRHGCAERRGGGFDERVSPSPLIARTSPGLVQNCPAPSVNDCTKALPSALSRAFIAAWQSTTGLLLTFRRRPGSARHALVPVSPVQALRCARAFRG
jgi:hypothetical protein